jgi:hypothetical protein
MKSIETTAKFHEDGTIILKLDSLPFVPGIHKVILVIEENLIINLPKYELNPKDKLKLLLDSIVWDNEQYDKWIHEKESLYGWIQ